MCPDLVAISIEKWLGFGKEKCEKRRKNSVTMQVLQIGQMSKN